MAKLSLGIGHIHVTNSPDDVIVALGLGSCVALVLFDASTGTIGAAHCMLPARRADARESEDKPGRYVDVALPNIINQMGITSSGSRALTSALVGGAAMFQFAADSVLDIGTRNIAVASAMLDDYDIPLLAADVGGSQGRSVTINVAAATVRVRTGNAVKELVCLQSPARRRQLVA